MLVDPLNVLKPTSWMCHPTPATQAIHQIVVDTDWGLNFPRGVDTPERDRLPGASLPAQALRVRLTRSLHCRYVLMHGYIENATSNVHELVKEMRFKGYPKAWWAPPLPCEYERTQRSARGACRTVLQLYFFVLHSLAVANSYWYMDPMPAVRVVP